jgi:septum formation protein
MRVGNLMGLRMPPPLILASTSPYRAAQLRRLGLDFTVESPGVDEDEAKGRGLPPRELAVQLAIAKARAVAARHPHAAAIGGDQAVALGDQILGKPGTAERAVEQLLTLADTVQSRLSVARLTVLPLTRAAAERYVAADQPLNCAGSYKFEARGIALFERVETEDPSGIEGLPLLSLCEILRSFGWLLP